MSIINNIHGTHLVTQEPHPIANTSNRSQSREVLDQVDTYPAQQIHSPSLLRCLVDFWNAFTAFLRRLFGIIEETPVPLIVRGSTPQEQPENSSSPSVSPEPLLEGKKPSVLILPFVLSQKIFKMLVEEGAIESFKMIAQTCKLFHCDIVNLNFKLYQLRLLYKIPKQFINMRPPSDKIRILGWATSGDFDKNAHIGKIAHLIGGSHSPCPYTQPLSSHALRLFHLDPWVPFKEEDFLDERSKYPWLSFTEDDFLNMLQTERIDYTKPLRHRRRTAVQGHTHDVAFHGYKDKRSLEECGFIVGHLYYAKYSLM